MSETQTRTYRANSIKAEEESTSQSIYILPSTGGCSSNEEPEPVSNDSDELQFLCFDLSQLSITARLTFLSCGVFFFFISNSYVEEYIFHVLPQFHYGWFLTYFELCCFASMAALERCVRILKTRDSGKMGRSKPVPSGDPNGSKLHIICTEVWRRQAQLRYHFAVAVAMTASRGLTNVSLQYLSYPTQIVCKSMKLITVMIGSVCFLSTQFTFRQYFAAVCLVTSVALFSFGDMQGDVIDVSIATVANSELPPVIDDLILNSTVIPSSALAVLEKEPTTSVSETTTLGLIIVASSLVADSAHATTQDSLMRAHHSGPLETMLYTNLFSALLSLCVVILKGELYPACEYVFILYPRSLLLFLLRASVTYAGVMCFLLLIKAFGVVLATGVTTVRKIVSILLSYLFFPKPFRTEHMLGIIMFCIGLFASMNMSSPSTPKVEDSLSSLQNLTDETKQAERVALLQAVHDDDDEKNNKLR